MRLLTPACPGQSPKACHAFTWLGVPLAHESHEEVVHVTCRKGPALSPGTIGHWAPCPRSSGPGVGRDREGEGATHVSGGRTVSSGL